MMSTSGITSATSTTHESASNSDRNAQPAHTAAASFAKFAGSPHPSRLNTSASTANTSVASQIQRLDHSGSATSTSASVPGNTTNDTRKTFHACPMYGRCGATRNQATTIAASTANRTTRGFSSTEEARPTTCRAA